MPRIIGIDLGTTTSSMAVMEGDESTIIANAEGQRTTASVVGFAKDGSSIIGDVARRQQVTNPERTIAEVKRHMGTDWTTTIDGKTMNAQQVSAMILSKLKKDAEAYLNDTVDKAVITVPAYFNDAQRQATKDAGQIAGLEVLRIINEPTSAALAYGLHNNTSQKVLVYDLGGGTFDVSVLDVDSDNEGGSIEVLASTGDNNLGGKDFNEALAQHLADTFNAEHGIDLMADTASRTRLVDAAETAKIELSSAPTSAISLPYISMTPTGPLNLDYTLTREEFNDITAPLLERTGPLMQAAVQDASLTMNDITTVLLVGGSTRMPAVAQYVENITGKTPSKSVNPDEVVATGAAYQGEIVKTGTVAGRDMVLIDRLALSFGVEASGGRFVPVVEKGETVPTVSSLQFSTAEDNQTSVFVQIFQGDRPMTKDCKKLGDFELAGILPAPAGTPKIEVTFDVDVNSNLTITAKDVTTGNAQTVKISGASGMTPAEIEKAVADAKAHAEEDERLRKQAQAQATRERQVRQANKLIHDYPDNAHVEQLKQAISDAESKADEASDHKLAQVMQEFGASVING